MAETDYTPSEARICIDFCNAATKRPRPDGSFMSMEEADAAFSRWLAAHDAEAREKGEPSDAEVDAAADAMRDRMEAIQAYAGDIWPSMARVALRAAREARAGVVAEEPEWEYGTIARFANGLTYSEIPWGSREQAEDVIRDGEAWESGAPDDTRLTYELVKRVPEIKPGPWVPVKQEGADGG